MNQQIYPTRPERPTWLEIDLNAVANNSQRLRTIIGSHCLLMAVVKANAYGHGAVAVARTALEAGADRLAVASFNEALELRQAGILAPLLVLGYTPPYLAADMVRYDLSATLFDQPLALALDQAALEQQKRATVHLKVNTGMNRLGCTCQETLSFLTWLREQTSLTIEGIYTHFATSDEIDKSHALAQFQQFSALLHQLDGAGLRPPIAHAANSAATLTLPQTHLQMVRCGIALYGLHPDAEQTRLPEDFQPALSWKAEVAHILHLQPGDAVSYGREFVTQTAMTAAVVPVGYADGFPRKPSHWGSVLIREHFAPIVGRVCMDQTIVDISEVVKKQGPIQQGEEVVLIGRQGTQYLSVDEVGRRLNTINYDVVSRILSRVPRIYSHQTIWS